MSGVGGTLINGGTWRDNSQMEFFEEVSGETNAPANVAPEQNQLAIVQGT